MEPGVGGGVTGPKRKLFCPRCGAANPPRAARCEKCGQDLRLIARAIRFHEPHRWARPALLAGALVLLLLASLLFWQQAQRRRTEISAMQRYLNGVWATEVERWDLAVKEFEAAGDFRDAPERLSQAQLRLNQVEERYAEALAHLQAGRPWEAAYLLQQVTVALPNHPSAREQLAEARRTLGEIILFRQSSHLPPVISSSVLLASAERGEERELASSLIAGRDASFSPDGRWLSYEAERDGRTSIWLVNSASGRQVALAERVLDGWVEWSPDNRRLLYGWEGRNGWAIWLFNLTDGTRRQLVDGADIADGDFSPRGRWITLWERRRNQWSLLLVDSRNPDSVEALTDRADLYGFRTWSSDEGLLAYGYYEEGQWRFFLGRPGEQAVEIAQGSDSAWLYFQPGSRSYVMWRWQAQIGTLSLHSANRPTGRELLRGAADAWVRWSPDGRWLATAEWNGRTWRLLLFEVVGAGTLIGPTILASNVADVDGLFAADSQRLLYRTLQQEGWTVVVRELRTGREHLLLAESTAAEATWAPDGEHVLLWWMERPAPGATAPSGEATLAVANAISGQRVRLREGLRATQGAFSRDGSKMALTLKPVGGKASVWVANPDGSDLLELDRDSYRIYWALAPFQFGPHLPGPTLP